MVVLMSVFPCDDGGNCDGDGNVNGNGNGGGDGDGGTTTTPKTLKAKESACAGRSHNIITANMPCESVNGQAESHSPG